MTTVLVVLGSVALACVIGWAMVSAIGDRMFDHGPRIERDETAPDPDAPGNARPGETGP